MIRVAAVGTGYWGPNLARNLHALGALEFVCDLLDERAAGLAAQFGVRSGADFAASPASLLKARAISAAPGPASSMQS